MSNETTQCPTCSMYGILSCRESVGTCGTCGERGDVFMDYSVSGDRENPNETLCLNCLDKGVHMSAAHEKEANTA